ncbi:uncharacterized protein BJX67DRAFT_376216 [Aspergillus lucknowensis]|uniref:CorA-like transporter domain-containing protein n=1 Tax=Aspergillus lucknowensis TaxID=176173 RepID=A0ABR4M727_9EURO
MPNMEPSTLVDWLSASRMTASAVLLSLSRRFALANDEALLGVFLHRCGLKTELESLNLVRHFMATTPGLSGESPSQVSRSTAFNPICPPPQLTLKPSGPRPARGRANHVSMKIYSPSSYPVFCKNSEESEISVIDINTPTASPPDSLLFKNDTEFVQHVETNPEPRIRIISICSRNSVKPLCITQSGMQALLDHYDIGDEFLDLVHSFGGKQHISDSGHGDVQYLLPYVEDYTINGVTNYTDRCVCVFNRFSPEKDGQNLWIFLHVKRQSEAQTRIEAAVTQGLDCYTDPCFLHLVILSAYIGHWRACIRGLAEDVEGMVDKLMVSKLTKETDYNLALDWIVRLFHLHEKLLPLGPKLQVTHQILQNLIELNSVLKQHCTDPDKDEQDARDTLGFYLQRTGGYLQSLQVLDDRLRGAIKLLEVALDLGNRNMTGEINKRMLQLTTEGVNDSASVKVITFLTTLYLPASFASTFLGMNVFDFRDPKDSHEFATSKSIWLFFVLWLILSLLTFLSWKIFWSVHRRRRQKSNNNTVKDLELGHRVNTSNGGDFSPTKTIDSYKGFV